MPTSRGRRAACTGLLLAALPLLGGAPASAQGTAVGGDQLAVHGTVVPATAPPLPATVASGWLVADLDTGDVLAAKDPHGRYPPASTLKALTALTLIPRLAPGRQVTPTFADVKVDGSRVGLVEHVAYPVSQLFTAMLVVSGNDAANSLATANGGVGPTVAQMNVEAAYLRALDTHANTPNGLDSAGQTSSAYDLALIARAAMRLPDFRRYVATKHSTVRGLHGKAISISSHDKLLYNYPGAIGIKNGYTVAAGATFIGAATRGGHTLVVTLLHTAPRYWPEAAALLDWGFAAESRSVQPVGRLVDPGSSAGPSGRAGAVTAVPAVAARVPATGHSSGVPVLPVAVVVLGGGAVAVFVRRRWA